MTKSKELKAVKQLTDEELLHIIFDLSADSKAIEARLKELKEEAKIRYPQDVAVAHGNYVVTVKGVSRSGVDTKRLKNDFPGVYDKVLSTTTYQTVTVNEFVSPQPTWNDEGSEKPAF